MTPDSPLFVVLALLTAWVVVAVLYHYPEPSAPANRRSSASAPTPEAARPASDAAHQSTTSLDSADSASLPTDAPTTTCPACGDPTEAEYRFCRRCAAPVPR